MPYPSHPIPSKRTEVTRDAFTLFHATYLQLPQAQMALAIGASPSFQRLRLGDMRGLPLLAPVVLAALFERIFTRGYG